MKYKKRNKDVAPKRRGVSADVTPNKIKAGAREEGRKYTEGQKEAIINKVQQQGCIEREAEDSVTYENRYTLPHYPEHMVDEAWWAMKDVGMLDDVGSGSPGDERTIDSLCQTVIYTLFVSAMEEALNNLLNPEG